MNADKYNPMFLLLEPIVENDYNQYVFLAKRISTYLSDNNKHNSIISYEQLSFIPKIKNKVPIIILIPTKNERIGKYDDTLKSIIESEDIFVPKFKDIEILNNYPIFSGNFKFQPIE